MKRHYRIIWVFFLAGLVAANTLAQAGLLNGNCPPERCCCMMPADDAPSGPRSDLAGGNCFPASDCDCSIAQSYPDGAAAPLIFSHPNQGWTPILLEISGIKGLIQPASDHSQPILRYWRGVFGAVPLYLQTLSILC